MKILYCAALLMLASSAALAAPSPKPTHAHAVQLVKLPNGDYTLPPHTLNAWGEETKVTFHPEGLKTLVTVEVSPKAQHTHQFTLKSGADCVHMNAVKPIGPVIPGQAAQTLVSVPITGGAFDVQDATSRQQFQEVCAHGS